MTDSLPAKVMEIEDDIFDRNIDQLDVRETPRCELTEEEESDEDAEETCQSDVDTLINTQSASKQNPASSVLSPLIESSNYGKVMACETMPQKVVVNQCYSPKLQRQANMTTKASTSVASMQGTYAAGSKTGGTSVASACIMGSSNKSCSSISSTATMSPRLSGRKINKNQLDQMMNNAYLDDSDSVKDFGAEAREKEVKPKASKEVRIPSKYVPLTHWEDEDMDSVKDFSGSFRKKEQKYMYRTDEAIYQRAQEEQLKRPPDWEAEEIDSVRNFGLISNKHEIPSGQTSMQISRMPSDEDLCLSPPFNDEDDGLVQDFEEISTEDKNFSINKMVTEERMRQIQNVPVFADDEKDSTKDWSKYRRTGTAENSRRPSSENIYLTPPWVEEGSCAESGSSDTQSPQITLDEHRAIEEEARNAGLSSAGEKAQALREGNAQTNVAEGTAIPGQQPGRDSGFCSEQDQQTQQGGLNLNTEQTEQTAVSSGMGMATAEAVSAPVRSSPLTVGMPTIHTVPQSSTMPHVARSSNPLTLARVQFPQSALDAPVQTSGSSILMQSKLCGSSVQGNTTYSAPVSTMVAGPNLCLLGSGVGYTSMRYTVPPPTAIPHKQQRTVPVSHAKQDFGSVPCALPRNRSSYSVPETANNGILRRGSGQAPVPTIKTQEPLLLAYSQLKESHPAQFAAGMTDYDYDGTSKQNEDVGRSISHSSLEAMCYSPHDALEGFETASVISFASTAATHHDLDTKTDMVQSLLSLLGTHDKDDMSRTLLAMSNSRDSCAAMRQSGCLPLLIDLLHGQDFENNNSRREARARAGLALHNIVYSNVDDRRGRREVRVLRLLEIVRAHCDVVRYKDGKIHACAARWYPPLRDHGPGPAVAALMKLSFEDEHRNSICDLGGLQAIAELVEVDHTVNGKCNDPYSLSLRKYTGMTLTNLTFGHTNNKKLLCGMKGTLEALVAQLETVEEEEVIQMAASVLKNLSWRTDDNCRLLLRNGGVVKALIAAAQNVHGEPALRTILSALWNFSAHCAENKVEMCEIPGALRFLVKCLNYCSPSSNLSVIESSGGILRNLSSHIALRPDYRKLLRENGCFQTLLTHLRSPSLRIISNACGALWNLSARCVEDQELLWELGAVSLLKSLVNSKHKVISTSSSAALRNLMSVKPGSSSSCTETESVSSRGNRHYRSMPPESRTAENEAKLKAERWIKSQSSRMSSRHSTHEEMRPLINNASKASDSSTSLKSCLSSSSSNCGGSKSSHPLLLRSRSDVGPSSLLGRLHKGKYSALPNDTGSVSSNCSVDGRQPAQPHSHLHTKWSDSNNSLARHRRKNKALAVHGKQRESNCGNAVDITCSSPRQSVRKHQGGSVENKKGHSRSASDGNVIQLVTDGYPLLVTAKPAKKTVTDKHLSNNSARQSGPVAQAGYHYLGPSASGSQVVKPGESKSFVSPGTARRLNHWIKHDTKEENAIPMTELAVGSTKDHKPLYQDNPSDDSEASQNALQEDSKQSCVARTTRRRQAQKFRSYRDSGSEPEADIDSDDERNLFHAQKSPAHVEVKNAWLGKNRAGNGTSSIAPRDLKCTCEAVPNVWVRRADGENDFKSRKLCENCSVQKKSDRVEAGYNADKKELAQSSQSGDHGLLNIFKRNSGRESRRKSDSNKTYLKVTSL